MLLPVAEAARMVGLSRSGLMRAIQRGTVSASRDESNGQWLVDSSEVTRVYKPVSDTVTTLPPDDTELRLLQEKLRALIEMRDELRAERDYLRAQLEREHTSMARLTERLNLPAPPATRAGIPWPLYVIAISTAIAAGLALYHVLLA